MRLRLGRLNEVLKAQMRKLRALEAAVEASPDKQMSLTDPDTRQMVMGEGMKGVVGYNVQSAMDTEHHLIIAHEVTNQVVDRGQLPRMPAEVSMHHRQGTPREALEA